MMDTDTIYETAGNNSILTHLPTVFDYNTGCSQWNAAILSYSQEVRQRDTE
jgi:hypothetical protein